jgi:hypothetical protein
MAERFREGDIDENVGEKYATAKSPATSHDKGFLNQSLQRSSP